MTSTPKCTPFYQDIDGFLLPGFFWPEVFKSALQYKPQKDDFFIATFPKCGTTWTQQIVTLILNGGQPVSDFAEYTSRTWFLEMLGTEGIEDKITPGSIKVHLPYHLTPISPEAKYLYVTRNPKDTLVSFYHHTCTPMYHYQDGEFNNYFEIFLKGENDYGDYFDHVLGWYEHRDDPNVMFLTYEELKRDTENTVRKIAKFMGDQYYQLLEDESIMKDVLKYSSVEYMKKSVNDSPDALIENMKKGAAISGKMPPGMRKMFDFFSKLENQGDKKFQPVRKGIVGDWRNNFTEDQARRMDARTEAKLKGTNVFNYWKSINCI